MTSSARGRRLAARLPPEERRAQILEAARELFSRRPFPDVSTTDIADAAGVTRGLVHHYFGSARDVYVVIVGELVASAIAVPGVRPGMSRRERVAANLDVWLDMVEREREAWLAVAGTAEVIADPEIRGLLDAAREAAIDRMIAANADVVSDGQVTRLALRGFFGLNQVACREWFEGRATRSQVHGLLVSTFLDLIERVVPRVERETG